jgi:site-specific DNA recombinase
VGKTLQVDGYVRVSRVGGRAGESYGSPEEQERAIRAWARERGARVDELVVEEDVSGGKRAEERELGRLIERVERGESDGIVCYRLSRFGRSLTDILANVERLKAAGGRLVCTADGIDSSSAGGKLLIGVLGTLAEIERDTRAEYWKTSVRRAIERGQFIGGRAPIGYRLEEGRLVVDPDEARVIRKAFGLRARGESWERVARWMAGQGHPMSTAGVQSMVASRTYRGDVFRGKYRKADAHPAIVPENEWQAAQWSGERPVPSGRASGRGILAGGLAVCAGCGRPMGVNTGRLSGKYDTASYVCKSQHRVKKCRAPASASVAKVDAYVEAKLFERMARDKDAKARWARADQAKEAVNAAEAEMDKFLEHASAADLGERYGREVKKRREAIRKAKAEQARWAARELRPLFVATPEQWGKLAIKTKREMARGYIERVVITRTTRGRWQPMEERVEVEWLAEGARAA